MWLQWKRLLLRHVNLSSVTARVGVVDHARHLQATQTVESEVQSKEAYAASEVRMGDD